MSCSMSPNRAEIPVVSRAALRASMRAEIAWGSHPWTPSLTGTSEHPATRASSPWTGGPGERKHACLSRCSTCLHVGARGSVVPSLGWRRSLGVSSGHHQQAVQTQLASTRVVHGLSLGPLLLRLDAASLGLPVRAPRYLKPEAAAVLTSQCRVDVPVLPFSWDAMSVQAGMVDCCKEGSSYQCQVLTGRFTRELDEVRPQSNKLATCALCSLVNMIQRSA
jgi:hypothetical protein